MEDPILASFTRMIEKFRKELDQPNRSLFLQGDTMLCSHDVARREIALLEERVRSFSEYRRTHPREYAQATQSLSA